MKRVHVALLAALLCPGFTQVSLAQTVIEQYEPLDGEVVIGDGPGEVVRLTERGYTLVLPEKKEVRGLVVFFEGYRVVPDSLAPEMQAHAAALAHDLGVLYVSTGNPVDFFFSDEAMETAYSLIRTAVEDHGLPDRIVFAGYALGGLQALKLAVYLEQHHESAPAQYGLQPCAIAIGDAPIDMIRFWREGHHAIQANFNSASVGEGKWVSYLLQHHLGTPEHDIAAYIAYSPYTYLADDGGNARYLRSLPIRAYTEPDVEWWIKHRRKSFYGMDTLDLAGLVNELKLLGNEDAELILMDSRHNDLDQRPHSWSLVNKDDLMDWFVSEMK